MENNSSGAFDTVLDRALQFLELKDLRRTGWVLRGIENPESVADHSWSTALLCLLYAPLAQEALNRDRTVAIALVHDLAEVEVGDIPRRVIPGNGVPTPAEKAARERHAMERLTASAAGPAFPPIPSLSRIHELWGEYEAGVTVEAQFVRDMNLVDMCLQALLYERDRRYDPNRNSDAFPDYERLDEFFATAQPRITTETGKTVFVLVESRYHELRVV